MVERRDHPALATFFVAEPAVPGRSVALSDEEAHHARVRRIEVGVRVRLVDGAGTVATATLVKLSKTHAVADVLDACTVDPPPAVHLLVPVADRDRMLWLAEKATELGLASWRPVWWRRSRSVSPRGEGLAFQAKVRARMVQALKQSGGAWLPALHPDATLERAIAAAPAGTRLLLDRDGEPVLSRALAPPVTLALGPEGGIESEEGEALVAAQFAPTSLVPAVLRFETAGIAAVAVVRAALTHLVEDTRG
jgi:16S rRNA (uracil1498-N3)-methyltransferase